LRLILETLEVPDYVVYPDRYDVLIVEVKALPFQKTQKMILPVVEVNVPFHIVLTVVGERAHDQKVHHNANHVPCHLNGHTELKEPVCIKQVADDEDAEHLIEGKGIPKDVQIGRASGRESGHKRN